MLCTGIWLIAVTASAQDVEHEDDGVTFEVSATLASSYIDTDMFMDQFGTNPVLRIEPMVTYGGWYLEPYLFIDMEDGLDGESAEWGGTLGYQYQWNENWSTNVELCRFENYGGQGSSVGDWCLGAGVSYRNTHASATALWGESDTVILNLGHDFHLFDEEVTISPGVAYYTSDDRLNPGGSIEWTPNDHTAVGLQLVWPEREDEDTGRMRRRFFWGVYARVTW